MPEYLVGKIVTIKKYYDKIIVFSNNLKVCEHEKIEGYKKIRVDINHYLNTLLKKPGAIRNSLALKSIPELKDIFDIYYSKKPRKFIQIFMENENLSVAQLVEFFKKECSINSIDNVKSEISICDAIKL